MSRPSSFGPRLLASAQPAQYLRFLVIAMVVAVASTIGPTAADAAPTGNERWEFTLTEVGDLGGTASFALDIATNGTVVGTARSGSSSRPQVAFADDGDGGARSLGTLPDSTFSRAMGVNSRGTVVGEAFTPGTESSRAVTWDRFGRLRVLPGLRGADSSAVAHAVNQRGDIAGVSTGSDGRATAVVWPGGRTPRALPWLADVPGAASRAWDLDALGTVVGSAATADDDHLHFHAVLWDRAGRVVDLGVLEDHGSSVAYAVAHRGVQRPLAVGEASLAGGSRAVVFTPGGPKALPTPGDYRFARATDIGINGAVVGHAAQFQGAPTFGGAAVLWLGGKAYPLADLVRDLPPEWRLHTAEAIDDRGRIVGYGTVNGQTRGFLLTPTGTQR